MADFKIKFCIRNYLKKVSLQIIYVLLWLDMLHEDIWLGAYESTRSWVAPFTLQGHGPFVSAYLFVSDY